MFKHAAVLVHNFPDAKWVSFVGADEADCVRQACEYVRLDLPNFPHSEVATTRIRTLLTADKWAEALTAYRELTDAGWFDAPIFDGTVHFWPKEG